MKNRWLCWVSLAIIAGSANWTLGEEAILLRYKAAPGDSAICRQVTELKQKVEYQGIKLESSKTSDEVVTQTVDAVADDGKVSLTLKNERLKVAATYGPEEKYSFDSKSTTHDKGSIIGGALTPLNERVAGAQFQFSRSPRGTVVEVKGYKELIAESFKDNALALQLSMAATNEEVRLNLQDQFVVLAEQAVKPGDKWEVPYELEIPNYGKTSGKVTYTFEGPGKFENLPTAKFSIQSDVSLEMKMDFGGVKVTGGYSTRNSSGTIHFDPAKGRVVSAVRELTVGGQLSVDDDGMIFPVQLEQTQGVKFELLDKLPE